MGLEHIFASANVSASGLSAERLRMEIVANNIANAHSTRTAGGGPYRRQDVVFSAILNEQLRGRGRPLGLRGGGVEVFAVIDDQSEFPQIFQPGHPDAGSDGLVQMPNVQVPLEMVNLITANRAYEANLKVLQAFRQQSEQALSILRG
ncbi:MAG: flagellar basal body rod protein FlgC [Planctomycetes bacterium]|nr:flagellar basal body rod protein FlgC [Planctomycetota bacterium]